MGGYGCSIDTIQAKEVRHKTIEFPDVTASKSEMAMLQHRNKILA
jgi:hypothetical protein